jgi:dihydrofolate reductase
MAKLVSSILLTLDGFVAGPNGELDIFNVDQEFFDQAGKLTEEADTAMYGRGTYGIMESYWPTAGDSPDASSHDKEHAVWYNKSEKIILSTTMKTAGANSRIIGENVIEEVKKLKQVKKRNIQIFGSPGVVRSLMKENLIDEYWIFLAPVVLGKGLPLFEEINEKINLRLIEAKTYSTGIVALHYVFGE